MVGTRVFTLEKVESLRNAFNKEMTRKPPLLGTTTKGQPEGFHLEKLGPPKMKSPIVVVTPGSYLGFLD
jgi:hypothetical protein